MTWWQILFMLIGMALCACTAFLFALIYAARLHDKWEDKK